MSKYRDFIIKTKCIKILPHEVIEVTNYVNDPDFKKYKYDCSSLIIPQMLSSNKYCLAFFYRTNENNNDEFNIIGSMIYNNYKSTNCVLNASLYGPIFIVNEDILQGILTDFKRSDLTYLIKNINNFDRKKMKTTGEKIINDFLAYAKKN